MEKFITELRVRHYEMDTLGHVNNAVYQNYLEQAAIEHSEHVGLNLEKYRELGGVFVLQRIEIEYLRPAFAGDLLSITTWVEEMKGSRAKRYYEIRHLQKDKLLVKAEAVWVWVNAENMRPRPVPESVLQAFGQI
jgi:acyl-CoA thioester hydrolase